MPSPLRVTVSVIPAQPPKPSWATRPRKSVGFVGCGDDTPTDSGPPADLIGTWVATSSTFTEVSGGATVDRIAAGVTLTWVFRSDLTNTVTVVLPGPPEETDIDNGTFTATESVLTVNGEDEGATMRLPALT